MGVRYVERRPGYAPIWTEERIHSELQDYLNGREQWPSREEFERDGRKRLRDAVNRAGGPDRWAAEFALPRPNRLSGTRRGWTPEAVEAELTRLIGDRAQWPSRSQFRTAGLAGMLTSIYEHEGPEYWAERMGVERRPAGPRRRDGLWTEARILDELERFCAGRELWPTEREFATAGKRALYAAASRKGGIPYWARRLGLARRRARS